VTSSSNSAHRPDAAVGHARGSRALLASLACLIPLLTFSFFVNLPALPIRVWDEARNANNALEVYLHHNWLVPSYDGLPDMWNTKPPLLIWTQVAAMHLFGVGELAVRLPAAIAATGTALVLWAVCALHYRKPWTGFLAGAGRASTKAYVVNHAGRTGDYDSMLTLFLTSYSLSALIYTRTEGGRRWIVLFWVCAALAVLTKGVAGMLLFPGVLVLLVVERRLARVVSEPASYLGALGFLLAVGGYYVFRERANPGYWNAVVNNEIVGRYVEGLGPAPAPFFFYVNAIYGGDGYWIWFLLPAFAAGLFLSRSRDIRQLTLFNLIMVASFWMVISAGRTKMEWYALPLFPFFSLQIGILLGIGFERSGARIQSPAVGRFAAVLTCALLFAAPFASVRTEIFNTEEVGLNEEMEAQARFLQHSIREGSDLRNYVFCFRGYNAPTNFYVKLLRSEGTNIEMRDHIGRLVPGAHAVVVASQNDMLEEVEDVYSVSRIDERFGCVVDTVLDRAGATDDGSTGYMKVLEATYGANCRAAIGNATDAVADQCNDRGRCDFLVDFMVLGDPAPRCAKEFHVKWQCDGETAPRETTVGAEAGFGSIARLRCAPAAAR